MKKKLTVSMIVVTLICLPIWYFNRDFQYAEFLYAAVLGLIFLFLKLIFSEEKEQPSEAPSVNNETEIEGDNATVMAGNEFELSGDNPKVVVGDNIEQHGESPTVVMGDQNIFTAPEQEDDTQEKEKADSVLRAFAADVVGIMNRTSEFAGSLDEYKKNSEKRTPSKLSDALTPYLNDKPVDDLNDNLGTIKQHYPEIDERLWREGKSAVESMRHELKSHYSKNLGATASSGRNITFEQMHQIFSARRNAFVNEVWNKLPEDIKRQVSRQNPN